MVLESHGDVICLQETKRELFDISFIRNLCPLSFDSFQFKPSVGALGGILIIWKGSIFSGVEVFQNEFAISMEFTSKFNNESWILTTVYAPCTPSGKRLFLEWFKNIHVPDHIDWLIVGDFNLIRTQKTGIGIVVMLMKWIGLMRLLVLWESLRSHSMGDILPGLTSNLIPFWKG